MNELIKNPVIAFIAGLLILWLTFKVLGIFLNLYNIFVSLLNLLMAFSGQRD
jgi:hypothetical protein